jgi:hypothetical protein
LEAPKGDKIGAPAASSGTGAPATTKSVAPAATKPVKPILLDGTMTFNGKSVMYVDVVRSGSTKGASFVVLSINGTFYRSVDFYSPYLTSNTVVYIGKNNLNECISFSSSDNGNSINILVYKNSNHTILHTINKGQTCQI